MPELSEPRVVAPRGDLLLRPGDGVRVVSPSGPADPERVEAGMAVLRGWGLHPTLGAHALELDGYLAGSDEARAGDLMDAFTDPATRAVLCTRGGYGSTRVLDLLDFRAIARDPKLLVGSSDTTALLLALRQRTGVPVVHGPPVVALGDERRAEGTASLRRLLFADTAAIVELRPDVGEPTAALREGGRAEGVLMGGNLALLAAACGTPDALDPAAPVILLLEDTAEAPYRIDRMLGQLRRSDALARVAGVAIGQFTDCHGRPGEPDAVATLAACLGALGVPLLGGLPVGHGADQLAVPLGGPAELDAEHGVLRVAWP